MFLIGKHKFHMIFIRVLSFFILFYYVFYAFCMLFIVFRASRRFAEGQQRERKRMIICLNKYNKVRVLTNSTIRSSYGGVPGGGGRSAAERKPIWTRVLRYTSIKLHFKVVVSCGRGDIEVRHARTKSTLDVWN